MGHETSDSEPRLAPPGAGIPLPHRLFMTYVVRPLIAARSDWQENAQLFRRWTEKIDDELVGLSEAQLCRRVLVPSQVGLEDSSRFWSVAMALEHLVIVGSKIEMLIGELADERVPPQAKVETAAVKPLGELSAEQAIREFRAWAYGAEKRVLEKSRSRTSRAFLVHPWFGPFNSLSWQWLLAQHHGIHLKQIREIKKGLR